MNMDSLKESIASIVSISPRQQRGQVEAVSPVSIESDMRSDQEAIWGDFCAVGVDLRMGIEEYQQQYDERLQEVCRIDSAGQRP
ncbi:hypothetical protein [Vreelandella populi]|uniref:hypothetical protein n=1 Tax=Vreelandella populi TaxID=2498858 RepID=UPI00200BF93C|nr:hypothetical protein [Halomonas populi]